VHLTPSEFQALERAVRDSHSDYDDLRLTVRHVGWRLQDISAPGPMPHVALDLIEFAEANDGIVDLIAAARARNPTNVELFAVAGSIGLEPAAPADDKPGNRDAVPQVSSRLERLVDPERGISDLGSFAARLNELLRQVCRVEIDGTPRGTGFLIGPRTVLTNHHVVKGADPAKIRLRFDYRRLEDKTTLNGGSVFALADHGIVHLEPHSAADVRPYDSQHLPQENELDYAVLETADAIGRLPSSAPDSTERGWLEPRADPATFVPETFLWVVQHPCGDPISWDAAQDAVIRVNPNSTRVHYRVNTLPGSSGSPVLDRDLALVALHHAGQPGSPGFAVDCHRPVTKADYNEGIPIARIQEHLADRGLEWVFGSEAP
jgi:V8-like Glu-specific endopeptidase